MRRVAKERGASVSANLSKKRRRSRRSNATHLPRRRREEKGRHLADGRPGAPQEGGEGHLCDELQKRGLRVRRRPPARGNDDHVPRVRRVVGREARDEVVHVGPGARRREVAVDARGEGHGAVRDGRRGDAQNVRAQVEDEGVQAAAEADGGEDAQDDPVDDQGAVLLGRGGERRAGGRAKGKESVYKHWTRRSTALENQDESGQQQYNLEAPIVRTSVMASRKVLTGPTGRPSVLRKCKRPEMPRATRPMKSMCVRAYSKPSRIRLTMERRKWNVNRKGAFQRCTPWMLSRSIYNSALKIQFAAGRGGARQGGVRLRWPPKKKEEN